jgi:addiction module RelE/StbE family toxin
VARSKEEKWGIVLSKKAVKSYESVDEGTRQRFTDCIDEIEHNPFSACDARPLTGRLQGYWRCIVGGWRVIYQINKETRTVEISVILPRGDVYKK